MPLSGCLDEEDDCFPIDQDELPPELSAGCALGVAAPSAAPVMLTRKRARPVSVPPEVATATKLARLVQNLKARSAKFSDLQ